MFIDVENGEYYLYSTNGWSKKDHRGKQIFNGTVDFVRSKFQKENIEI
jgi:hypothetical protein